MYSLRRGKRFIEYSVSTYLTKDWKAGFSEVLGHLAPTVLLSVTYVVGRSAELGDFFIGHMEMPWLQLLCAPRRPGQGLPLYS